MLYVCGWARYPAIHSQSTPPPVSTGCAQCSMVFCHACEVKYDARVHRQFCPKCNVVAHHYKESGKGKADSHVEDSDFDISGKMADPKAPMSPTIERDPETVSKQIALEEEKNALLKKKRELMGLEARLTAIRLENEQLELQLFFR